jgi:hypothetical protein
VARQQHFQLRALRLTFEKAGRLSMLSTALCLTDSVFSSLRYSSPLSFPRRLLSSSSVYSFNKCPMFSIF